MNCHDFLKAQIAADGPMQTDRFMQICLSHQQSPVGCEALAWALAQWTGCSLSHLFAHV